MENDQSAAAAPAAPLQLADVDRLEHIGKCATLLLATCTSMMEPLVALIGYAPAKGLLDQIAKAADMAVGAAAGKVQAKSAAPFADASEVLKKAQQSHGVH